MQFSKFHFSFSHVDLDTGITDTIGDKSASARELTFVGVG